MTLTDGLADAEITQTVPHITSTLT